MKLISKTLLYYLLISLPLLVVAGFLSYHLISEELKEGVDKTLWKEKSNLETAITKSADPLNLNTNELIHISVASGQLYEDTYSDTVIYDSSEQEDVEYRLISGYFNYKGQNYKIEIARPTMEDEELRESLVSTFSVIGIFLVLAFFVVSWLLSKTLWKPFYRTLEKLAVYELKNDSIINFEKSTTQEFNKLNDALNKMTQKMHADFLQQKEFTENASHEMQTPLAIIKANISLLIQSPHMNAQEMNQVQVIDDTTKKLASLNKVLLLLAKIDNNQFKETFSIDLADAVNKVSNHLSDLTEARQIKLENKIKSSLNVLMNPVLADVLITNLFQNAIRHNFNEGQIHLEIIKDTFIISNSGEPLKISDDELFTRFKKNEASKESLGLGLAIVKSICSLYGIQVTHVYQNNMHSFILKFNNL